MFPLYRGPGARLLRALTAFAIDRHSPAYEEIRPPTVVLTETMTSTGHLPKFADDAYHLERDDLWLIPTAEVPLTSMHRGEILEESQLPLRFTAATACYRREAGSAGRDTRGLLRVHEFDKVELFAYTTPEGALEAQADILQRAESMLQELELPYRVLDLCCGDLGGSSARTFDLEVYAPGRRPLARGELGQLVPRLPGPPGQRALPPGRRRAAAAGAHRQRLGAGLAADLGRPGGERAPGGRDGDAARVPGAVSRRRAADQGAVTRAPVVDGSGPREHFGFGDRLETIAAESRRLADMVAALDLEARVPSTPEWSVRDLAHHIGEVQWYWGENVRAQNADERSGAELTAFPEDSDLLAWLGWCTYSLLGALREVGPDAPCWAWWPEPHTAGAVGRHQAQEVAVHRWDAEGVTGVVGAAAPRAGRRRGARVHRDHGGVRPGLAARRRHADRHRHRGELARRRGRRRSDAQPGLRAAGAGLGPGAHALPAPAGPRRRGGGGPDPGGGAALAGRHVR